MKSRHYRIVETTGGYYPQYRAWYGWTSIATREDDARYVQPSWEGALRVVVVDREARTFHREGVVRITELREDVIEEVARGFRDKRGISEG